MYGSAAEFTTYHEARGRTVPGTWDTDKIEAALLVASEWIDNKYGDRFVGFKTGGYAQEREWPRETAWARSTPEYIFDDDEIPTEVVYATYEAAFREATSLGSLYADYDPQKYNSVSISGAISVQYAQNLDVNSVQKQIQIIEQLLSVLFGNDPGGSSLSGGSYRS